MNHRSRVLIINAIDAQLVALHATRTAMTLAGGKDCDAVKGIWLLIDELQSARVEFTGCMSPI